MNHKTNKNVLLAQSEIQEEKRKKRKCKRAYLLKSYNIEAYFNYSLLPPSGSTEKKIAQIKTG